MIWKFRNSFMKNILFLSVCIFFFMFSCSDSSPEDREDPNRRGTRRGGRSGDGDQSRVNNQVKNVCKGGSYTIHSYGECPDFSPKPGPPKKPVDILFVIDTSNSMYFYLNSAFKKRFKNFISTIDKNLAWRMFFTNAKYSDSGFNAFFTGAMNGEAMKLESSWKVFKRTYLDNTVPYYGDVFRYTITRDPERRDDHGQTENTCSYPPYCQSGAVTPLRALQSSFSANKHLTRKGVDFVAVIVTDMDEESMEDLAPVTAETIIDEFEKIYGSSKRLMVFNLIVLPGDKQCAEKNEDSMGRQICNVIGPEKIGGDNFSICLPDYSVVAEAIVNLTTQ